MAENDNDILAAFVGFVIGVGSFIGSFKRMREKRLIENTPTSKVRSIAMGLVELKGKAVASPSYKLKSPFSGKPCVYYRYTIEEFKKRRKNSEWVTIRNFSPKTFFFLQDETGSVLVNPENARIDIPYDFEFNSSMGQDPPKKVIDFLKSEKVRYEGLFGINRRMRFREYLIEEKNDLFIFGTAGDNPFVEDATGTKNEQDIMIHKGSRGSLFVISDKSEKGILNKLNVSVYLGLIGGPVLAVACLIFFLFRIGVF